MVALGTLLFLLLGLAAGQNKVLYFPTASASNYISFKPGMPALSAFTVCSWQKILTRSGRQFWFSYYSVGRQNDIVLGSSFEAAFHVASDGFKTGVSYPIDEWFHYCVKWDSTSGEATFYINGKENRRLYNVKRGYTTKPSGQLVIAQDQGGTMGGDFDAADAFVGFLYDINMWDYALSSIEIAEQFDAGICSSRTAKTKPLISYEDIISQQIHGAASLVELGVAVRACKKGDESDNYGGSRGSSYFFLNQYFFI